MQNELSYLIQLQSFDSVTDELSAAVAEFDTRIAQKNSAIEALKAGTKSAKDKITGFQLKKKQLELDAENQEKLVKKHQSELNALKSNDQYKAMLSEIDNAKKAQSKIEDEILVVMESIDGSEKELKDHDSRLKSDEGKIKSEIQALESEKAGIVSKLNTKKEERATFAATVPAPLLHQYDSLRKTRGNLAIVPLVNNKACGGCRMNLTPARINDVKKAKAMVLCDSCSRIIYLPQDPSQTPPTSPAAEASPQPVNESAPTA